MVREALTLDYGPTEGTVIAELLHHAYNVAIHSQAARSICFTVGVAGNDQYGHPKTMNLGVLQFNAEQVQELRKYASVEALDGNAEMLPMTFANAFAFVGENIQSPYCLGKKPGYMCMEPPTTCSSETPTRAAAAVEESPDPVPTAPEVQHPSGSSPGTTDRVADEGNPGLSVDPYNLIPKGAQASLTLHVCVNVDGTLTRSNLNPSSGFQS